MEAESPASPPITVSEPQSVTSTTKKMMDTLDLVASEVRQTKDSLMLSTTQAIKRWDLVSYFLFCHFYVGRRERRTTSANK